MSNASKRADGAVEELGQLPRQGQVLGSADAAADADDHLRGAEIDGLSRGAERIARASADFGGVESGSECRDFS